MHSMLQKRTAALGQILHWVFAPSASTALTRTMNAGVFLSEKVPILDRWKGVRRGEEVQFQQCARSALSLLSRGKEDLCSGTEEVESSVFDRVDCVLDVS